MALSKVRTLFLFNQLFDLLYNYSYFVYFSKIRGYLKKFVEKKKYDIQTTTVLYDLLLIYSTYISLFIL